MKKTYVLLLLLLVLLPVSVPPAGAGADLSLRAAGTVSAVAAGLLTIATTDGQTMSFRLVATTTYAKDGQAADVSVLANGVSVKVKYHQEPNGSLKAKEVTVETAPGVASAAVRVSGSVISVSADTLVIRSDAGGQELTMRLSPATAYEQGGRPAVAGDLRPGQSVRVKYRVEPDRSLKAEKVKIEVQRPVSFRLEGTVAGAAATSLRVRVASLRENGALVRAAAGRAVAVMVSPEAVLLRNGRKLRLGALAGGERVHVSGTVVAGVFSADRIVAQRARRKR